MTDAEAIPTTIAPDDLAAATSIPPPSKSKANFSEVQETVSRLAAHKGVTSVLILNQAGDILTQTGNGTVGNPKLLKTTLQAAARYIQSIPSIDDDDDDTKNRTNMEDTEGQGGDEDGGAGESGPFGKISFVRIRSNREEILVAPKNQYVLVVIQDPALASL